MGIEQKVGDKDIALRLGRTLVAVGLPENIVDKALETLEGSYAELKEDINGRYYSGCCI